MTVRVGDRQPLSTSRTPPSAKTAEVRQSATTPAATGGQRRALDGFEQPASRQYAAQLDPQPPASTVTDAKLTAMVEENFKAAYGNDRVPTPAERQKWLEFARTLRAQGHGANHIKQMMLSGISQEKRGGNDTSDAAINTMIDQNFKDAYGADRVPTGAERTKWLAYARQLRAEGHGANHIKQMMLSGISQEKGGGNDTSDAGLNKMIDQNFKAAYGDDKVPSASERQKWLNFARQLRAEGHGANHINQMMLSGIGGDKGGVNDTSDTALNKMIDQNFKAAYGDDKVPSASERQKWLNFARQLRAEGHGANHINQMMLSGIGGDKGGGDSTGDTALNAMIDQNFKDAYGADRVPTGAERAKWLAYARQLRAEGHGANHIKQMMSSGISGDKQGGNDTSDAAINKMIDENFKATYDANRVPTGAERAKWLEYARQLRAQGHGANHIRQMMLSGIGQDK
ncbi:hypothetical protein [Hyalangium rubrum]|uniref:Uncharacterized protein n=1 Tax=Hyalangium rubrum TaxID=3103134 RepID=A0ABU5HF16_9BACT|nr:hypothetical protein [Hyalangium sp. s54d21]MDY7231464.1 hypothetical protein [Hyalangium sp. s54d21]